MKRKYKCDICKAKECETRDLLRKYPEHVLRNIVERNCEEFEKEYEGD